ncbi:Tyrosine--tRNA ligase, mitochondrial [Dermatophagoides farinae]|uniref:Tyrosine--tRNA ligase n=1 Tax=Dermatophagoides farinae TaxID=6954 RepID=A0A922HUM3_DERFA|nr:Tyrosine--tRNA ligase, mitochondrial [Dermatophagoides farinae]
MQSLIVRSVSILRLSSQLISQNSLKRFIGSKIYDQLSSKGLFSSYFPQSANINEFLSRKQIIYAGFDPTNKSLHVGNLLVLISLFHLHHHGHRIILLIGDATAHIGDPSGKVQERPILSDNLIDSNACGIEQDIQQVFDNYRKYFAKHVADDREFVILRNSEWFNKMNVVDFINKYARYLRMGDMLNKSAIRERLESPSGLSFAEFAYQTFQAYDWYHLFKQYGCRVQVGGVDQTEIKLAKSEGKAVFLNPEMTTPFGLYQYFMRIPDRDINRLLKLFSFRPLAEIETLILNQMKNPKPWQLQKRLAEEMTLLVHGQNGLDQAKRITSALFDKNLDQLGNLNEQEINDVFDGVPIIHMEFIEQQTTVLNLAMQTNFFHSEIEAINTIKDGGFYINYNRHSKADDLIENKPEHILKNHITIVSLGKRNHCLIKWL